MKTVLFIPCLFTCSFAFAQSGKKDTLSAEQTKEVMQSLSSAPFLKEAGGKACDCIAKIKVKKKSGEDVAKAMAKCIEKESESYSMMSQMVDALKGNKKDNTIVMSTKGEHDKYYFELEEWLKDSCGALSYLIASDNKESSVSMSTNKKALKLYEKGQDAMNAGAFVEAALDFRLALNEDSVFSFAWDNLGVSLRKSGNLKGAIDAYKKSLALDPKGATALQNLALVYSMQEEYNKSIEAYKNMIAVYPKNAEGYYGAGQAYGVSGDLENSLQYLCKAYNLYTDQGSPYRVDAQSLISALYQEFKKQKKEEVFESILKENNIRTK